MLITVPYSLNLFRKSGIMHILNRGFIFLHVNIIISHEYVYASVLRWNNVCTQKPPFLIIVCDSKNV